MKNITIGHKFKNLEVVSFIGSKKDKSGRPKRLYLCKCLANGIECKKFVELETSHIIAQRSSCCGSHTCSPRFRNLIRQKFVNLIVIDFAGIKNNCSHWKCLCKCGSECIVKGSNLLNGQTKSCVLCVKTFRYEQIPGEYFNSLRASAKRRGLGFNIKIEDLWIQFVTQDGRCKLTNQKIILNSSRKYNGNASLDRIDSDVGYVLGNIQWVHKDINLIKIDLKQNEFINWCSIISNYKKKI